MSLINIGLDDDLIIDNLKKENKLLEQKLEDLLLEHKKLLISNYDMKDRIKELEDHDVNNKKT